MSADCIFCEIVKGAAPATVVYEDQLTMSFLPLPDGRLADGHLLVIPKRHATDLFEVDKDDLFAVVFVVRRVAGALRKALGATGVNVLNASGPNSDQSVFHLHFHVVPRWMGDGLNTWPKGKSEHRVSEDYAAQIRNHLAGDIAEL